MDRGAAGGDQLDASPGKAQVPEAQLGFPDLGLVVVNGDDTVRVDGYLPPARASGLWASPPAAKSWPFR